MMDDLHRREAECNQFGEQQPANQRTFLIAALRVASARARLATNLFDLIGIALRERLISPDQATAWLAEEALLEHVERQP
jgi:hypothetical protein